MTFNQVADHLNKKGILSVRGKKFKSAHVHSIIKKRRIRDEKLEKEYPEVRSDFRLETFDKRLINQLFKNTPQQNYTTVTEFVAKDALETILL